MTALRARARCDRRLLQRRCRCTPRVRQTRRRKADPWPPPRGLARAAQEPAGARRRCCHRPRGSTHRWPSSPSSVVAAQAPCGILGEMRFRTTVELGGKTATGLEIPDDVLAALGSGKRPAVRITIGGHTYRTTVASRGGRFLVPLSAENRAAAGVAAGEQVDVEIQADTEPREVSLPADLADALARDSTARDFFDALSYTHRKEWVHWIEGAKKPETRRARVANAVAASRAGKRSH